jgi:hypothetical protein
MIERLRSRIVNWWDEPAPGGLSDFLHALLTWWLHRPVLARCERCGQFAWSNRTGTEFCSEGCAKVYATWEEEEIPF